MAWRTPNIIPGKRYRISQGSYVEDERGRHLGKRVMWFWVGLFNLSVKTQYGYPVNKITGKPYIDEGFSPDE